MDVVRNIKQMYEAGDGHAHVLAASIRHLKHLLGSFVSKKDLVTAPSKVSEEWAASSFPLPGADLFITQRIRTAAPSTVRYETALVDGVNIAYREAGNRRIPSWLCCTDFRLHGHKHPDLISPDNWNMDFRFMERPNARRINMDLLYDYRTNVALYPQWQKFLRDHQPKTIIFWGENDIFLTRDGGEAYLSDLPDAEMHRLDSGHFAVEDCLEQIAENIQRFYDEKVTRVGQTTPSRKAG